MIHPPFVQNAPRKRAQFYRFAISSVIFTNREERFLGKTTKVFGALPKMEKMRENFFQSRKLLLNILKFYAMIKLRDKIIIRRKL